MALNGSIASRARALAAFRASIRRGEQDWSDHRFAEIRERHLEPLVSENERFDRELESIDHAVRAARRHLEQSR